MSVWEDTLSAFGFGTKRSKPRSKKRGGGGSGGHSYGSGHKADASVAAALPERRRTR